jgi:Xaa-Pro aminopeptidase
MKKFGITLKPLGDLIMKQRLVKDGYEIEQIKKALKITKVTLSKVAENMYGNTEKEVASEIEIEFKKHFSDPAFPTIVASGRNSTFIHHKPSEKIIKKNEPVLIDLGAKFNHYCSDFTRTFCSKNKDERKLYEDVLEIQRCLIEHIKPGVDFKEIQNLYSEFLRKNRYKKFHSFGHSVGLSTHETLKGEFKENMIITVEPGVYLSNFGCRIEDMILIRKGKAKIL